MEKLVAVKKTPHKEFQAELKDQICPEKREYDTYRFNIEQNILHYQPVH